MEKIQQGPVISVNMTIKNLLCVHFYIGLLALNVVFVLVKWIERENKVILKFHEFVVALVTTNPVHLRHVMMSLADSLQGLWWLSSKVCFSKQLDIHAQV